MSEPAQLIITHVISFLAGIILAWRLCHMHYYRKGWNEAHKSRGPTVSTIDPDAKEPNNVLGGTYSNLAAWFADADASGNNHTVEIKENDCGTVFIRNDTPTPTDDR